jgi:hypothetical protein
VYATQVRHLIGIQKREARPAAAWQISSSLLQKLKEARKALTENNPGLSALSVQPKNTKDNKRQLLILKTSIGMCCEGQLINFMPYKGS